MPENIQTLLLALKLACDYYNNAIGNLTTYTPTYWINIAEGIIKIQKETE